MGVPTLVVAGTGSGSGKTTITCALAAALAERGLDVRLFKAGPDYLDPTFHEAVLGRPSRNLDAWMTGREGVLDAYVRGTAGAPDIALVEGVMGLYDGRDPTSLEGSTAEVARVLGAPVLLVVDAAGMARSAAAVVGGFVGHDPDTRVEGVLFNRVGSAGHTAILEAAVRHALGPAPRVLGGLPKQRDLFLPSRHLGLHAARLSPATRTPEARASWRRDLAAWAREHVDLDGLLGLARTARPPAHAPRRAERVASARIGLARDDAFHFYYPDNLEMLAEAGAELVPFSPLADPLPGGLDGVILGGGYPEEHAAELAERADLRRELREFAASGRPVYGECGGLMFLGESLEDGDGRRWPMVGALPLRTRMEPRLRALGYREVTARLDTPFGPAGIRFRGHEFHYSTLVDDGGLPRAWGWTGRRGEGSGGFLRGRTLASYVHAHWGSRPAMAAAFVAACAEVTP